MVPQRQGDWLLAEVGDVHVIMSREQVHHIGVTAVGARIWEIMETPKEIDVICAELRKEYSIGAAECRAEVSSFLDELAQHGAVALDNETQ